MQPDQFVLLSLILIGYIQCKEILYIIFDFHEKVNCFFWFSFSL